MSPTAAFSPPLLILPWVCSAFSPPTGAHVTPTANISINYLRPVPLQQDFYVTSTIDHMGRRLNQTHCTMYLPNAPEKPCVTAVGTYYVLDEK